MKLYFILGLMGLVRPLAKNIMLILKQREKKAKKTKQINKIIEKEREIQKLIYSIKPKNYVTQLFTKKGPITQQNIDINIELAKTLAVGLLF